MNETKHTPVGVHRLLEIVAYNHDIDPACTVTISIAEAREWAAALQQAREALTQIAAASESDWANREWVEARARAAIAALGGTP